MRDYAGLVKALQCCCILSCSRCPRRNKPPKRGDECRNQLESDAADAIEELLAERDRYKSFFDRITDLPDCNICLKKNRCEFEPRPGENTRINCAFCLTAPPKEDAE